MMHTFDGVSVVNQIEGLAIGDRGHPVVPELTPKRSHLFLKRGWEDERPATDLERLWGHERHTAPGVRVRDAYQVAHFHAFYNCGRASSATHLSPAVHLWRGIIAICLKP